VEKEMKEADRENGDIYGENEGESTYLYVVHFT